MRCYTTDGSGFANLKLEDRPAPAPPSTGQVLVDVHAVSLNYRDLQVAQGRYGAGPYPPFVVCSDMAGVVAAVGEGVTSLQPGDRVLNCPFRVWPAGQLCSNWVRTFSGGAGVDGVLAQQITYPAQSLVKLPGHLDFVHGSTLTIAGLTAWAAVVTFGQTLPGQWVLTHGTGGVSVFATQMAKLIGAKVILTTSSPDKARFVREKLGVDETVDYRDANWRDAVLQITAQRGIDVVVETAGGKSLTGSIQACGYGGRVAVIGSVGGLEATINIRDLLSHQVTLRGIFMQSAQEMQKFVQAVDSAKLQPIVDRVFPFGQAQQAYEYLKSAQHVGKVVVQVR